MNRIFIAWVLVVCGVAFAYVPSGEHFRLAARSTGIATVPHHENAISRRNAVQSIFTTLGAGALGVAGITSAPQKASAVKDCFLDCKSNCLRNAPKSGDYCVQR